ncbi:unnamed protein product [Blepharisma stoltei]|uniref:Uncharacterized protein n=1 Tax=Blepharisma stoltei TaxID=1481888 RepID=A0AAU9IZM0_9CILI|nr:unnamed protein product [Blepharisma stoltei]
MALASIGKHLGDKLAYYKNWKFNFQKTRVIGSLRHIDEALDRYTKAPFLEHINRWTLLYHDPDPENHHLTVPYSLYYEEAYFLNYVVDHWKFDTSKLSKYELKDYNLAVEKLKQWKAVRDFSDEIREFMKEMRFIIAMRRNSHTVEQNKALGYPEFEKEVFEKYKKLEQELNSYPEWKAKVMPELENQLRVLYDQGGFSKLGDENPFKELNIQKFFK